MAHSICELLADPVASCFFKHDGRMMTSDMYRHTAVGQVDKGPINLSQEYIKAMTMSATYSTAQASLRLLRAQVAAGDGAAVADSTISGMSTIDGVASTSSGDGSPRFSTPSPVRRSSLGSSVSPPQRAPPAIQHATHKWQTIGTSGMCRMCVRVGCDGMGCYSLIFLLLAAVVYLSAHCVCASSLRSKVSSLAG